MKTLFRLKAFSGVGITQGVEKMQKKCSYLSSVMSESVGGGSNIFASVLAEDSIFVCSFERSYKEWKY